MDGMFFVNVVMRWLHVGSAVAAIGGVLLMRFAVIPALERLPNGAELYASLVPGFKKVLHSSLGLAIVTGLYNFAVPTMGALRNVKEELGGYGPLASYHAVAGVKILLSFALFGLAIAMLKPSDAALETRKGALTMNLLVGLVILAAGAYLRRLWTLPMP
jgi:hypothetical protein